MKTFFRTVLGDKPVEDMGLCYAHEHIVIEDSYVTTSYPQFLLNDTTKIARELADFYLLGGRTVVDTMPADCGRNVKKLAQVSELSRVHIIAPNGIHLPKYYPPYHWQFSYSADRLTELFIADVNLGIDKYDYHGPHLERTTHRAGLIKLASGDGPLSPQEIKLFTAAVDAQRVTGVPILTHTNGGKLALAQVELLIKLGARLDHVIISHTDKNPDLALHRALLSSGVYLEYDSAFRWKTPEPNHTFLILKHLLPDYHQHIMLGMDLARHSYWKSYGGQPGLTWLIENIPMVLKQWGMEEFLQDMFYRNPAAAFSFVQIPTS